MTIKMRLTLLFAGVIAIILGILMWSLYGYITYQRFSEFNTQLYSRALTAATVALENDEMTARALEPFRKTLANYQLPDESISVFDDSNRAYFHSGIHQLAITPALRETAIRRSGLAATAGDTQMVFFPYLDNEHLYVVEVSAIDTAGINSLRRLGWALMAGFAISITVVCGVGWWFASRAMAPITATTRQAERISATDLHIRLDEGNGKDELAELARAFNAMLHRLERAFDSQKQFVAHASHEIRTPLTALEGQLEVALMRLRTEREYEAILQGALDDTRQLRRLANDLLMLARANSELFQRPLTIQRLDEAFFSALEDVHKHYPERTIDVQFTTPVEDERYFQVQGNEDLLRIAIVNVLENAIKYSEPPSTVHAELNVGSRAIRLTVIDSGSGISDEDIPHIFDPFFRSSGTSSIPGTGIGLALVRTIVQHHHGAIAIDSRVGHGTAMTIELPVAPLPARGQ
ncbi:MAG: two-component sensor histidine kinase [Chlorobi bacterium]|nr:two-component sensor histidine kinase [Chlorobiota bacterium]